MAVSVRWSLIIICAIFFQAHDTIANSTLIGACRCGLAEQLLAHQREDHLIPVVGQALEGSAWPMQIYYH